MFYIYEYKHSMYISRIHVWLCNICIYIYIYNFAGTYIYIYIYMNKIRSLIRQTERKIRIKGQEKVIDKY